LEKKNAIRKSITSRARHQTARAGFAEVWVNSLLRQEIDLLKPKRVRGILLFPEKEAKSVVPLRGRYCSPKSSAKRNHGGLGACPQEIDLLN
jgi:hypothetical protein